MISAFSFVVFPFAYRSVRQTFCEHDLDHIKLHETAILFWMKDITAMKKYI